MASSSDSDQHRAVKKNGHDSIQDREIRDMRADFRDFQKEDRKTHEALLSGVNSANERLGKYVFAGRIIWAVIGAALVALGSLLGWMTSELGDHDDRIQESTSALRATLQRDIDMRSDLTKTEQDLRELRRLVQQHQINKREHLQFRE